MGGVARVDQLALAANAARDVGANRYVALGLAILAHVRGDRGVDPVELTILAAVAELPMPGAAVCNRAIHLLEELSRMLA